jgi:hypothetical protein
MTDIGDMIERGSDGPEWAQHRHDAAWREITDQAKALAELAALRAEVERLQERFDAVRDAAHAEAKRVFPATVIESHFGGELHADDLCSMLAAEVERLREALQSICQRYCYAYQNLAWGEMASEYYSAYCIAAQALQPLPAPPAKEE